MPADSIVELKVLSNSQPGLSNRFVRIGVHLFVGEESFPGQGQGHTRYGELIRLKRELARVKKGRDF